MQETPIITKDSDIKENSLLLMFPDAFEILLQDHTTGQNIYWATDSYAEKGDGYGFFDHITIDKLTGDNGEILKPRSSKSKAEQTARTKDKAEVFTPAWVCNKQNNLVDAVWFGGTSPFNEEIDNGNDIHFWKTNEDKIQFTNEAKGNWHDYVNANRIEITCGEGPYITSRYDATTGEFIEVSNRIGLLDRKLRVVNENTPSEPTKLNYREWRRWATKALQSIYGFEWQGDNLLLAREAVFCTFMENYQHKWGRLPQATAAVKIAEVISWNLWQMDGRTCGLPGYTPKEPLKELLFKTPTSSTERLCRIMEWKKGQEPLSGTETIFKSIVKKNQ